MNLTLGTLAELKTHLLNEGVRDRTDFDGAIATLGRGVAARFERETNRKFARVVGDTFEGPADRDLIVLPRLPIEAITKIELREYFADGWIDQGDPAGVIDNFDPASGVVYLPSRLSGVGGARLRITYTGGYWFDESGDGTVDVRRQVQQGVVALETGAEAVAIEFEEEFDAAADDIVINATLVIPNRGTSTTVALSGVTSQGFTAVFGFPIQASGYTVRWSASIASLTTEPASGSLPVGATERPHDLFLAWLLQCEHAWGLRDKLGIAVAQDRAGVSPDLIGLSRLDLVPEVRAALATYKRFVL